MYYDAKGSYPASGNDWNSNDCSGGTGFATTLNALVTSGYLSKIPNDAKFPNNPSQGCYYYRTNYTVPSGYCGGLGATKYLLIFSTEVSDFSLPVWDTGQPNTYKRYCVFGK